MTSWTQVRKEGLTLPSLNLALSGGEKIAVKLCRSYSSSFGPSLIRQKPHSFIWELCLLYSPPFSIQHKVRLHLMVMSGWERGFLLPPFLQNIALLVLWVSQPAGTPIFFPSASDSHLKLTPIFTTLLGIAVSDNRDFVFILYAWLSYCCFSPLPWFSSFPGISPDFARYAGPPKCPWAPGWQLT